MIQLSRVRLFFLFSSKSKHGSSVFPGHFLSLARDKEILNFTQDVYAEHLRFRALGLSEVFIKAQT